MRKILFLTCLLLTVAFVCAADENAPVREITDLCRFSSSENIILTKVHDGHLLTTYSPKYGEQTIYIALPSQYVPAALTIDMRQHMDTVCVRQYDVNGRALSIGADEPENDFPFYRFYSLDPTAATVSVTVPEGAVIAEIHVYPAGILPDQVQIWKKAEKADIMLISAHQDDEELWFGGLLPYYGVQQERSAVVVYMTDCGRSRITEALNGLWAMGLRQFPEFVGLPDFSGTYERSLDVWGGSEAIVGHMVRVIRQYRPEVIVTHDWDGEYGHNQHKLTAQHIELAVKAAADPGMYPDSAELYGVWQTKKLYLHLSPVRPIEMNWDIPSDKLGGNTPYRLAEIGFSKHYSQHLRYNMNKGRYYRNNAFGLVYTTVGEDIFKDDLLENTPADLRR